MYFVYIANEGIGIYEPTEMDDMLRYVNQSLEEGHQLDNITIIKGEDVTMELVSKMFMFKMSQREMPSLK